MMTTTDGRPVPPDFLDAHPPFHDSCDVQGATPWDVLARWHREDGLAVHGGVPFVTSEAKHDVDFQNGANARTNARNDTKHERNRHHGWSLSLRDGGPPPGVRPTVCTLAWQTASGKHGCKPKRASHRLARDAGREQTRLAPVPGAAFASETWPCWETTHAVAFASLTCAFANRVLSLSNPADRVQRRAATTLAAAAGDALVPSRPGVKTVPATKTVPAPIQTPPNTPKHPKKHNAHAVTAWTKGQVTRVAIIAIEKTRANARAIARVASQPPVRAAGAPAVARERRRRARVTRDAALTLDKRLAQQATLLEAGLDTRNSSHQQTPAVGARAAVAEILNRRVAAVCFGCENLEVKVTGGAGGETRKESTTRGRQTTVAKVIRSPTPRRALSEVTNRRQMFSPVSPGTAASRRASRRA
jgi:hypothetical protein